MMTSGEAVKYKGSWDCTVQIMKNEGFMSMIKGAGTFSYQGKWQKGGGVTQSFGRGITSSSLDPKAGTCTELCSKGNPGYQWVGERSENCKFQSSGPSLCVQHSLLWQESATGGEQSMVLAREG